MGWGVRRKTRRRMVSCIATGKEELPAGETWSSSLNMHQKGAITTINVIPDQNPQPKGHETPLSHHLLRLFLVPSRCCVGSLLASLVCGAESQRVQSTCLPISQYRLLHERRPTLLPYIPTTTTMYYILGMYLLHLPTTTPFGIR